MGPGQVHAIDMDHLRAHKLEPKKGTATENLDKGKVLIIGGFTTEESQGLFLLSSPIKARGSKRDVAMLQHERLNSLVLHNHESAHNAANELLEKKIAGDIKFKHVS